MLKHITGLLPTSTGLVIQPSIFGNVTNKDRVVLYFCKQCPVMFAVKTAFGGSAD
jgi:hypothetical protein